MKIKLRFRQRFGNAICVQIQCTYLQELASPISINPTPASEPSLVLAYPFWGLSLHN